MKNSNKKDLYNVDALKEAYLKSVEYLDELKKYTDFKNSIKSKIDNYSNNLKKELRLADTEKRYKQIQEKLQKIGSIDSAYEKYYNDEISSNEVEKILQLKKDAIGLEKLLDEKEKTFKKSVKEFKNKLLLETKTDYKNLKQSVIDKGMKSMCFSPKKWLNDEKGQFTPDDLADFYGNNTFEKNIKLFKQQFLTNSFYYSNEYSDNVDRIGDYQMFRVWFDSTNAPLKFTNNKIVKDLPSPYEFYISQLNKQYNKNFETITIVTDDFSDEYWKYDDVTDIRECGHHYYVYVANLIAPKEIAEKLKNTEKQQTKKSIEELVKKYPKIEVIKEENYEYGKTNYKPQFTEELREQIREKFGKDEKNTTLNFCELFGYFDSDNGYHYYDDTPIVSVPNKHIANAIFETLEYMNELEKIKNINHTKNSVNTKQEVVLKNMKDVKFFPDEIIMAYDKEKKQWEFFVVREFNKVYQSLFEKKWYPVTNKYMSINPVADLPEKYEHDSIKFLVENRGQSKIIAGDKKFITNAINYDFNGNFLPEHMSFKSRKKLDEMCNKKFNGTGSSGIRVYKISKSVSLLTLLEIQANDSKWFNEEEHEKELTLEEIKAEQLKLMEKENRKKELERKKRKEEFEQKRQKEFDEAKELDEIIK